MIHLWIMDKSTSFRTWGKFPCCSILEALNNGLKNKQTKNIQSILTPVCVSGFPRVPWKSLYRFACSVGTNQNSKGSEERDYLLVFVLNSKASHPQDAHLVYFGHGCFLKETKKSQNSLVLRVLEGMYFFLSFAFV